jgi:formylglycine-generating enzyme required for sulfatase activity
VQQELELPFEMVTIPAGSFIMGDDNGSYDERPAHEVYIDEFKIGKYEITNAQYVNYLNEAIESGEIYCEEKMINARKGPYLWFRYLDIFSSPSFPDVFIEYAEIGLNHYEFRAVPGYEQYPVIRLNWYGAVAFCAHYGLRLPTEAEWEKACRGGQQLEYGTENGTVSQDLANLYGINGQDTFFGPAPVGSFPPNPYGLYDMCGNAAEYVFDAWDADYYTYSPLDNPKGPGPEIILGRLPGNSAVWRGGSWIMHPHFCRSAFRGVIYDLEDHNYLGTSAIGFRVAGSF